jgi:hypothetical protein
MDHAHLATLTTLRASTVISTSALPGAPIIEQGPSRFRELLARHAPTPSPRRQRRHRMSRVTTALPRD